MTTQATINDALAFVLITGRQSYLHGSTRVAIIKYTKLNVSADRMYDVTPEGVELAKQTKMWKAHEKLQSMGFEFSPSRHRTAPSFLRYSQTEQSQTLSGKMFFRTGFTGWHGVIYADMRQADGNYRVQEVKNNT